MRLQLKISLLIAFVVMTSGFLAALLSSQVMEESMLAELDNKSLILCQTTTEMINKKVMTGDVVEVYTMLQGILRRTNGLKYIYVVDFSGNIFSHTFDNGFPAELHQQHLANIKMQIQSTNFQTTDGDTFIDYCYPLIEGLSAHIHIGLNTVQVYSQIVRLRGQIVWGTCLLILVGAIIGYIFCRRFTRPLTHLIKSMNDYGKGDSKNLYSVQGGGIEIDELSHAFKMMIADKTEAEESLLDSRNRFRALVEQASDSFFLYTKQGELIDVNKSACESLGYSREELLLITIYDIDPSSKTHKHHDAMWCSLALGQTISFESIYKRKNGSTFPVELRLGCIQIKEKQLLLGLARDITDRKRAEEELLKIRKLESVGVLAGGIAHDFNNVLAAILGNISLALAITDPQTEVYELLNNSEKASLRAKDLTQQLLTFAKGGEPVKKIATIGEVVRDSAEFVLRGSNVRCDFRFDEGLWPLAIDTGQISQVIQNIIINANQAMPTGGTITIECSNYSLKPNDIIHVSPGSHIKIVIKDQGIGIPTDMLNKVFDPYFTTKQKGNGLGLAITHSIISKHDGYISVDSKPGQGTTFTIYLPASQERPGIEQEAVAESPANVHGRIMIMDDEEMVRALFEKALSRIGCEVVLAEDGDKAILLYKKAKESGAPIDLIIMDLTIPGGMGGKDAVKEIHKIDPEAKVIVSSGYSNDPVMANFGDYGFCAAMVKPFQIRELIEIVGKAVSS